jgi:3-deoxy-7-phosphoheptulonate synthase
LARPIVVDCSHGNSSKNYRAQPDVFQSVLHQVVHGSNGVLGMMLESNLKEGAQQWGPHSKLSYGVSITDSCIGWETTEALLRRAHECLGGIGGGITREQRRAEAIALEKEALAEPANWIPSEVAK